MKYLLHKYRGLSMTPLHYPVTRCKWLFLKNLASYTRQDIIRLIQRQQNVLKFVSLRIHDIFRINLIKPCKSLKKVLSCLSYVSNRCTCQYHGIRYSVCPEMEFGIYYQLILGRLNVKHTTPRKCRNAC